MGRQSLFEELNELEEWEKIALELNTTDQSEIIKKIYGYDLLELEKAYGSEFHNLKPDYFFKPHDQISFTKHPRFLNLKEHKHEFLELTYAYKGSFKQVVNGKTVHMREGDITILDTNVVHKIETLPKDTLAINILMKEDYFNEQLLARLAENNIISEFIISAIYKTSLQGRFLHFSPGENERIKYFIESIIIEIKSPQLGSRESINCYTVLLFTELMRSLNRGRTLPMEEKTQNIKTSVSVIDLIHFINDHFMDLSLEQIADHFHIHPKYLTRLLKKSIGKGYMETVFELRMEKAVSLLKNTQLTINEIAEKCGFSNINNFYKHFKQIHHMTPREYRNNV